MNLNTLKRSFNSLSVKIWTAIGSLSSFYMALPDEKQLAIYTLILPYLPSGGAMGLIASIFGIALRAKTKVPLSER